RNSLIRLEKLDFARKAAGRAGGRGPDCRRRCCPDAAWTRASPGYGFGLPITRELAELYGGSLSLSRSALGGLKAELRLPRGAKGSSFA
ncbi:MAG TPA: hypothetical protein VNR65_05100, partial [Geobacterales bacterium]|nr:hypothetical protein [Geobacterales bacterium]